jgi:hypothetical protein
MWLPGMDSNHGELDKILKARNLLILQSRRSRQKRQKQGVGTKSVQKYFRRPDLSPLRKIAPTTDLATNSHLLEKTMLQRLS